MTIIYIFTQQLNVTLKNEGMTLLYFRITQISVNLDVFLKAQGHDFITVKSSYKTTLQYFNMQICLNIALHFAK